MAWQQLRSHKDTSAHTHKQMRVCTHTHSCRQEYNELMVWRLVLTQEGCCMEKNPSMLLLTPWNHQITILLLSAIFETSLETGVKPKRTEHVLKFNLPKNNSKKLFKMAHDVELMCIKKCNKSNGFRADTRVMYASSRMFFSLHFLERHYAFFNQRHNAWFIFWKVH